MLALVFNVTNVVGFTYACVFFAHLLIHFSHLLPLVTAMPRNDGLITWSRLIGPWVAWVGKC